MPESNSTEGPLRPSDPADPAAACTVLCVGDDENNRQIRARILRTAGFNVVEAANGADALRIAAEVRPALIVLDIGLPDVNGFQICRTLKSNPATSAIAVLLVSAAVCVEKDLPDAVEHRSDAYLREPIQPETLVATAKALVRVAQIQQESLKTETRFRKLLESAFEGVWVVDADGRTEFVNQRMADMLKCNSADDLIGRDTFDFVPEEEREARKAAFRERLTSDGKDRYDARFRCMDGSLIWASISSSNLVDEHGRTISRIRLLTDITEQKRTQDALQRSQRRLELALNAAELGTWELDSGTGKITAGERTRAMFGFETADPRIESWIARLHPDDRERVAGELERAVRDRRRYQAEYRVVRPDGSIRWVAASAAPLENGGGTPPNLIGVAQDITERKRAEEAVRTHREWLRITLSSIGDAVMAADAEGRIAFLNGVAARLTGWTEEEAIGRPTAEVFRIVNEQTREVQEDIVARVLREKRIIPLANHTALVCRDGREVSVEDSAAPIQDSAGNVLGVVLVFHDVTEQRRAQEAVRESRAKLQAALDSMMDAVFISDSEGRFIDFNQGFAKFHRFGSKEECARTFADYPEILDVFFSDGTPAPVDMWAVPRALRGETVSYAEYGLRKKDTGETWFGSYSFAPIRDGKGAIVGSVVVARDITEHKRAEQSLRDSEEQLRQRVEELEKVMEVAPVAIWVAHDATCDNITGNQMANVYYEASTEENVSSNVSPARRFFQNGRELNAEELPMQQAVARGADVRDSELEVHLPSGRRLVMIGHASPLRDVDGQVRGCVGAFLDITERKQAEERVRQAQKLESVGLLAGGIAHDFNNLLTGILGNASLILNDVPSGPAGRIQDIIKSAQRAAHLTSQLLAYSGKGQFVVRDIDISQAVNDTADLVQFSIPKSVELSITVQRRLPPVQMDPTQLQQILMNLVINAGEAIGEGNPGSITVSTSMTDVNESFTDATGECVAPGRYVCIEVTDTGSGIDEDKRSRIFDPFFTTKFTGRGLGLAAVAGIVRSQQGAIVVDSQPGRGSTFRVLLPAAHENAQEPPEDSGVNGRRTVLVVDDEATVRNVIGAVLRKEGYRVLLASDGRDALGVCEREKGKVDAMVLDIVMPLMGANELLPLIEAEYPGTKVLLTSGYSEAEARRLCAAHPGATFIQKPYTAQQIAKAVQDLLSHGAATAADGN